MNILKNLLILFCVTLLPNDLKASESSIEGWDELERGIVRNFKNAAHVTTYTLSQNLGLSPNETTQISDHSEAMNWAWYKFRQAHPSTVEKYPLLENRIGFYKTLWNIRKVAVQLKKQGVYERRKLQILEIPGNISKFYSNKEEEMPTALGKVLLLVRSELQ